jgi:hypothetical protein
LLPSVAEQIVHPFCSAHTTALSMSFSAAFRHLYIVTRKNYYFGIVLKNDLLRNSVTNIINIAKIKINIKSTKKIIT